MLMQMNIWSYSTMEDLIKKAIAIITESEYIVAFTGAGVSTESGIPDFRSKEGIWRIQPNIGLWPKNLEK